MKKNNIPFFAVSVFSLMLAFLAGCSDIATDAYVFYSDSELVERGIRNVVFDVSSDSTLLRVTSSSRTLTPAAYKSSDLKFYLGGKNVGLGKSLVVQEVEFVANENSTSSGTITVPLDSYNYQLALLAIPVGTSITLDENTVISALVPYAVLAGSTTADLRYNNDSAINFYLSSSGLTGSGSLAIDFYLSNWSEASLRTKNPGKSGEPLVVNDVAIALYELGKDSAVADSSVTQSFSARLSESSAYSYAREGISAGMYELCVSFSYNDKEFVYSDKIIILPYQTTSAKVAIPDILQVVPAQPSNLRQGYIKPENDESNFYKVVFEWNDTANTETGFELQLLDAAGAFETVRTVENTAATWSGVADSYISTYGSDFVGSSQWYAGSLSRNSGYAIFSIPLGTRYLARIRAVNNDIGGSDWAYAASDSISMTIPSGAATAESVSLPYSKTVNAAAFPSAQINLFKLTYNLVGGTVSPVSCAMVYYLSQSDGGSPVLTPNGESVSDAYNAGAPVSVQNGNLAWRAWAIASVTGEEYPMKYTQCTSASVWNSGTVYYGAVKRSESDLNLSSTDINGNEYTYEKAAIQPTEEVFSTSAQNYYICENVLANYVGFENLSLYALYNEESGSADTKDYSLKSNVVFTVRLDGEVKAIEGRSFSISSLGSSLSVIYGYKAGAELSATAPYSSVLLTVTEEGGSELGTYTASGQAFSIPVSTFSAGTEYILTIKAVKYGATYSSTLFMTVE